MTMKFILQANLKIMRDIDDKIINTLNTKLPTNFQRAEVDPTLTCKELFSEVCLHYWIYLHALQQINFRVYLH